MRKLLIILSTLILTGCAALGMPGTITERVSGFDNSKEIVMEPAWLLEGGKMKLSLFKTDRMDKDKAILTVLVQGAYNFASKEDVQIKIDGEIINLSSIDKSTNIEMEEGYYGNGLYISPENWSSKRYEVSEQLIKKLINAKEVWFRVNLSRDYVEGKFSQDLPTTARPAFKRFYEKVWVTKETQKKG